jgi:NADPH-dependent glutamate synthase beta subunit-like oxidoreductase/Na+-translocating ferredoxin:NAD+ oxidoreductase RNF subunit RnfB
MLQAVILMGALGLTVGIGLAIASKIFYVYVDPKILAVEAALPGANCGGCGFPGCSANAEAIVAGRAAPNSCVAAGPDTAAAIAALLGVSVEAREPDISRPGCTYGVAEADIKFCYDGIGDCRAAALLSGGMKVCSVGCLGLGSCVKACQFNALHLGPQGLPVVDAQKCTGCGACERVCPKHIITLSSVTRRILHEYTRDDCTTPCQRACPAGIDICEYIRQVGEGDYAGAVQTIKERNPFPTVIGRICPRPCEDQCRRQLVDEPVAINALKRFAADFERRGGQHILPYKAPDTGRRIAVVGGGIQGLSAAFFSARLGHAPTLFEATDALGGLLRSAIARNRLPMEILDWDIEGIRAMGVDMQTGKALGRDIRIGDLLADGYQAVALATGGWDSRLARGAGGRLESPLPGLWLMLDVMRPDDRAPVCSAQTVVYGGAPLALEAARRCLTRGARQVTVVLRETEAPADLHTADGIQVLTGTAIEALHGTEDRLTGLTLVDLASGRMRPQEAGTLVMAAGRIPELIFRADPSDPEADAAATETARWTAVSPYKAPLAADEAAGLFSEADVLSDFSAAIRAIAAGRRTAATIHRLLYGEAPVLATNALTASTVVQNVSRVADVAPAPRHLMPLDPAGVELELGLDESAARHEAQRCLQCGLICYRHTAAIAPAAVLPAHPSQERAAAA